MAEAPEVAAIRALILKAQQEGQSGQDAVQRYLATQQNQNMLQLQQGALGRGAPAEAIQAVSAQPQQIGQNYASASADYGALQQQGLGSLSRLEGLTQNQVGSITTAGTYQKEANDTIARLMEESRKRDQDFLAAQQRLVMEQRAKARAEEAAAPAAEQAEYAGGGGGGGGGYSSGGGGGYRRSRGGGRSYGSGGNAKKDKLYSTLESAYRNARTKDGSFIWKGKKMSGGAFMREFRAYAIGKGATYDEAQGIAEATRDAMMGKRQYTAKEKATMNKSVNAALRGGTTRKTTTKKAPVRSQGTVAQKSRYQQSKKPTSRAKTAPKKKKWWNPFD